MNETKKTIGFLGAAAVLVVLAIILAPRRITPEAFLDQGEQFFPEFTDPNAATSLEVVDYDASTGSAYPFKVTFEDGHWVIPSHYNYPADAKDRLAQTAAGIIQIKKDDFRSDNTADHEICGVIDPLDETVPGLTGRGQRVTVRGANDQILADLIIGNPVPTRPGFRFVRLPDQKRVYAARVDLDLSTRFADWIDTDLLRVDKNKIDRIVFNDYSINERTGSVEQKDNLQLNLKNKKWSMSGTKSGQSADSTKVAQLINNIDALSIVGVRPKPAALSQSLQGSSGEGELSQADLLSLQNKGFFVTRNGQLMSNEGEMKIRTSEGITYTLRFGEVLYGSGPEVSAGSDEAGKAKSGGAENRYLFVTTSFDPKLVPEPPMPRDTSFVGKADSLLTDADRENRTMYYNHRNWVTDVTRYRKNADDLNARFADWYYVISGASFDRLRLKRTDLLASKS